MSAALLAITWEPELRGILIVIIGVGVLCGSVYLVLGHEPRCPARLPGGVHRAGRLDGADGRRSGGSTASVSRVPNRRWDAGPRQDRDPGRRPRCAMPACSTTCRRSRQDARSPRRPSSSTRSSSTRAGGASPSPNRRSGRPASSAGELLDETDAFAAGEFQVVSVFDKGGERYPKITDATRLHRLLPQAALRRRRGRPARADPHRARPGADATRGRHQPPAPVRVHGPRPRSRDASRRRCITLGSTTVFLCALLDAAPARPVRRRRTAAEHWRPASA